MKPLVPTRPTTVTKEVEAWLEAQVLSHSTPPVSIADILRTSEVSADVRAWRAICTFCLNQRKGIPQHEIASWFGVSERTVQRYYATAKIAARAETHRGLVATLHTILKQTAAAEKN